MPAITINGARVTVTEKTSVAAAILQQGEFCFRHSVTGEPRAALCGMGICYECRVTIDGVPHVLSCQSLCADGMVVTTG
jgi:aerobic-type carbon monoxide dehydrogenase small subunit (CoxS/CutS family)